MGRGGRGEGEGGRGGEGERKLEKTKSVCFLNRRSAKYCDDMPKEQIALHRDNKSAL